MPRIPDGRGVDAGLSTNAKSILLVMGEILRSNGSSMLSRRCLSDSYKHCPIIPAINSRQCRL